MLEVLLFLCVVSSQQLPTSAAAQAAVDSEFMPICDSQEYDYSGFSSADLPLPDLPDQFSFTIEGNLIEHHRTAIMTEYYDGPGNRGRLEFEHHNATTIGIFDYNLGEIFLIHPHRMRNNCRVHPIANNPSRFLSRTFGIVNQNGSIHIGSPRTFLEGLRENGTTVPLYFGEDSVRGIPTRRWQACFKRENNSYLIDYYFAAEDWDYEGQSQKWDSTQMVPIQFTLSATRLDPDRGILNIYHIYSVVDFRSGPDSVPDSLFRVPNGLACRGRFPGQPVPQIPQFFSTYVQQVNTNLNLTYINREFYDLPHGLFRIDIYNKTGVPGPTSIIHDFNTSVRYIINNRITKCSTQPLSQASPFFFNLITDDSGTLQLVSPNNFFFLGNEFNYSYEGVSNIRGVDVDSWVSVRDFEKVAQAVNLTDAIYEVFFTRPGWIYATDRSINTDPVPWRIKLSGRVSTDNATKMSLEMDFFDFSTDEPPYDAFDISSCSGPDDFYTMILIIPGQERGIDLGQLRRNIRTSVTNYTGLRPLQIGNIQIITENGTHIFVSFQISNLTSLAKIDPATIVIAQQAVDNITSNTVGSQLPFRIQISPNVSVTPSLYVTRRGPNPMATCNCTTCNCTTCNCTTNNQTVPTEVTTQRSGLSDGAVAGIAILLLILGIIIGVILQLTIGVAIRWFRTSSAAVNIGETVKYKKQEENVSLN